jgi:hypothetical protein
MAAHRLEATMLNEETLLGERGFARTLFPELRGELFFLLDDGWDVPIVGPDEYYGSCILDTDKFPGFTGEPAERIRKLNMAFKALGWRGIGLWIACQEAPAVLRQQPEGSADGPEPQYWVERLKWMAAAGVEYWKVDWGARASDASYRRMLTELAAKHAPGLLMEHANVCAPFNTPFEPDEARKAKAEGASWLFHDLGEQGRISPDRLDEFCKLVPISDVLRLYDVTGQLAIPTMLDRAAQVLTAFGPDQPERCLLNCEIVPYVGAGLGCCIGIMTHPRKQFSFHPEIVLGGRESGENMLAELPGGRIDAMRLGPLFLDRRMLEIVRTLRWHRIAPPFPVGGHETHLSDAILTDSWDLRSPPAWYRGGLKGVMTQRAPAVICRNVPPASVQPGGCGPDRPYVVASRHPNGALAVATLERVSPDRGAVTPLADIVIGVDDVQAPIGLFGSFERVTIRAAGITSASRIWAQDLAGDTPVDVTAQVTLESGSVAIPGALAGRLCPRFNEFDDSRPGIVLTLDDPKR